MDIQGILGYVFFGNTVSKYLFSSGVFLGIVIAAHTIVAYSIKRIEKYAEKTETDLDDFVAEILRKLLLPCMYLMSVYAALRVLTLNAFFSRALQIFGLFVMVFFGGQLVIMVINYGFKVYCRQIHLDAGFERSLQGLLKVIKTLIWGFLLVFTLDNLGFKISAVIAGLGIGGVAVALAAQALLKDFFSYFSILFDRPFKLGDFIIVGDLMGTVEYIGVKTTRIRSLSGEQIVFSNADLTDSRVRNYKVMEKRRVLFRIGVTYETPLEKVKEIPKIIEKIIKGIKNTEFDRAHFFSYGDFSLIFEVVYYVTDADYNKYMDVQQDINLAIKEEFEKRDIAFAYPTSTIYLNKTSV